MYISVDHSRFKVTAKAVDDYISSVDSNMARANSEVSSLSNIWEGKDKVYFNQEWNKVYDKDSTYKKMTNSLSSYSELLRYAGEQYKNAQSKAYDRSLWLQVY